MTKPKPTQEEQQRSATFKITQAADKISTCLSFSKIPVDTISGLALLYLAARFFDSKEEFVKISTEIFHFHHQLEGLYGLITREKPHLREPLPKEKLN